MLGSCPIEVVPQVTVQVVPQGTARRLRLGQCLLTEAIVHSETANRRRDMEKAIENRLSLRDLETVIGGAKERTYEMNGDTFVCTKDGCQNTTSNKTSGVGQTVVAWFKSLLS
jgi:hypothetical protein